jgi:glyoxylase-like metal-dependent hydrolase (beta-lactamase superfamily II)
VEAIKTTFKGKQVIKLKSGETISLIELPKPGISSTQTVVRIDKSGDLIVGDLAHTRHHTWLEGGIVDGKPTPDLAGWKADLKVLPTLGKGKVYGGRGDFVPVKEAVAQEVAYLEKADQIVDGYLKALGPRVSELNDSEKKGAHFAAISCVDVEIYAAIRLVERHFYQTLSLLCHNLNL